VSDFYPPEPVSQAYGPEYRPELLEHAPPTFYAPADSGQAYGPEYRPEEIAKPAKPASWWWKPAALAAGAAVVLAGLLYFSARGRR
jgi:hypothetical protein